jgi:hypothetical protein
MDAVMSTLLIAAAWLVVRARPERRAGAVIAAGAVAGFAFEVKLFEAVVALPALALLAWLALDGDAARRARVIAGAALAYVAAAACWPVVATLLPGRHPYPLGSSNGQIWNSILVYNGLHRVGAPPTHATTPGLLRLFHAGAPRHFGAIIGVELALALTFGALAALSARGAGPEVVDRRLRSAVGWGLGAWLVIGAFVTSFMGWLFPRYLESFTPAVAAVLGIGLVSIGEAARSRAGALAALGACAIAAAFAGVLAGGHPGAWMGVAIAAGIASLVLVLWAADALPRHRLGLTSAAIVLILVAGLALPLHTSLRLARAGASDSPALGTMPAAKLHRISAFLRRHQHGARYEAASAGILKSAALIVKDARPVMVLTGPGGRPLVTPRQLIRRVHAGRVRYALIGPVHCTRRGGGSGCAPVVRWIRAHGTDVTHAAGLPQRGLIYRL